MAHEHLLVTGGNEYLPFARSRITALRATGLKYASQSYIIGDAEIKVRIADEHSYIKIEGGGLTDICLLFVAGSGAAADVIWPKISRSGPNLIAPLNRTAGYAAYSTKFQDLTKFKPIGLPTGISNSNVYVIKTFYDKKPVMYNELTTSTTNDTLVPAESPSGDYTTDVIRTTIGSDTTRVLLGRKELSVGSVVSNGVRRFRVNFLESGGYETNGLISETGTAVYSNWVKTYGGVLPVCAWSVVSVPLTNGTVTYTYDEFTDPGTTVPADPLLPAMNYFSLGTPKNQRGGGYEVADLALVPASDPASPPFGRLDPTAFLSADIRTDPPTPLSRYSVDFKFPNITVDGLQVYAVCKTWLYAWAPATTFFPDTPITAVNYKTGDTETIIAPQFFDPAFGTGGIPEGWVPRHTIFFDDFIVLIKNDPVAAYFWMYVYSSRVSAALEGELTNLPLLGTYTNTPGDLGPEHADVEQVVIEGLPANMYLIGALRDETVCM